jgi:uncharacterized membrane protein AbrB (regulator of aidB expression)
VFFAAMPGGFGDMLLFGEEAGGDVRALSLIHATRVLIVVMVLPFVFAFLWHMSQPLVSRSCPCRTQLLFLLLYAPDGALRPFGLFGASILGPLFLTAALSLAGSFTTARLRRSRQRIFIGFTIGVKYAISWRERVDVTAGVIFSVLSLCISAVFAAVVFRLGWLPLTKVCWRFHRWTGGNGDCRITGGRCRCRGASSGADRVCHHRCRQ